MWKPLKYGDTLLLCHRDNVTRRALPSVLKKKVAYSSNLPCFVAILQV